MSLEDPARWPSWTRSGWPTKAVRREPYTNTATGTSRMTGSVPACSDHRCRTARTAADDVGREHLQRLAATGAWRNQRHRLP